MAASQLSLEAHANSQPMRSTLCFRRTSTITITAALNNVHLGCDETSQSTAMSQDAPGGTQQQTQTQPQTQRQPSFVQRLTVDVTRYPSQGDMLGTPDYATPVEQQFHVDYDVSSQQDQEGKSPAKSPVRHIKRPRHQAAFEEGSDNSQPSQSTSQRSAGEPSTSSKAGSGSGNFSLPPPPPPRGAKSRFSRPQSPASFRNRFLTGGDGDQPHTIESCHPRQMPLLSRLNTEFKVHKEIGSGNFSRVIRVTHRIDGCDYAIKRSKRPVTSDAERNRWLQEVQAMAAVRAHPHVVQYYGAWAEPDMQGDTLLIQMELCQESLAEVLAATKRAAWRESELVGVMKQMASALAHIHSVGVAHLDVKPDNIYRSAGGAYKLGDFGMATLKHGHLGIVDEGDSRYLAPELLNGDTRHLDKADLFALGATLYELATGCALPATGPLYHRLRQGRLALLPTMSAAFANTLKALMHEDPGQRPSAEVLLRSQLCSKGALPMAASTSGAAPAPSSCSSGGGGGRRTSV